MSEPRIEALAAAIQDGKPWLQRFTAKQYAGALEDYRSRFGPLYREAALAAGEENLPALADTLLDALAEGWARQRPWNRSVARINDKQILVCFLSPILLEDPACAPLAEGLQRRWAARWPKDAYQTVTAAKLQKGFRATFLGIPLPSRDGGEDE